ncbi:MAG TPA: anthranilate synthase component I family protein [Candidatus Omnitrophota bacterium]|nr:anthranilate synthase component I family protein [Candidatus Omnitrophota bacterium]
MPSRLLIFDHLNRTLKIVVFTKKEGNLGSCYRKACADLDEMTETLLRPLKHAATLHGLEPASETPRPEKSNMTRADFESKINRVKKYIRQGDCIQVVFSQRFEAGENVNCFEVYRTLRSVNPSPYMFFFRFRESVLIGSSPELLVKKYGTQAEIRPIAGTRPRGADERKDQLLERDLKASRKELAEHLMLVDLGRNDLGRVCRYNSVRVEEFARIERYSHVMHLVSVVTGQLKSGKDAFHLLRAAFPAGTVTGAPKVRAMQIIDELEETKRGPYAGCLGYFSLNGDMDMCIMIRTIFVHKNRAYVQAGAGIVYDSRPSAEYLETVNKAKALFRAIALSEKRLLKTRGRQRSGQSTHRSGKS